MDRLIKQPVIGDDIDRYPPRSILVVESPTFTGSCVELKGLMSCRFTVNPPVTMQGAEQQGMKIIYT